MKIIKTNGKIPKDRRGRPECPEIRAIKKWLKESDEELMCISFPGDIDKAMSKHSTIWQSLNRGALTGFEVHRVDCDIWIKRI